MRWIIILCSVWLSVFAAKLSPVSSIEAGGNVMDIALNQTHMIVGTDAGTLESYALADNAKDKVVSFEKIKDFMGDIISPKVFSVDYEKISKAYLAVVQKTSGSRELIRIIGEKKEVLIPEKEGLFISKAKFIDDKRVLLALLSNEYLLFDIDKKEYLYRLHVSYSHFSDFMINEDKTYALGGDESGKLTLINIAKGEITQEFKGAHVDNVYKVDIKSGMALGAGQDRRGSVYDMDFGSYKRFDADFLIYAGALSPSGKKAAFAFTELNDIVVFDVASEDRLHTLSGQKSTLNSIVFVNENELISGSDDKFIMRWKLP